MLKRKSSIKKILVTNIGLVLTIAFVYFAAFMPIYPAPFTRGPLMKGNTGGDNIALQISVDDSSDISSYLDMLDRFGIKATFFFPEQYYSNGSYLVKQVAERGSEVGFYPSTEDNSQRLVLYIGGGYSIPVMNYVSGDKVFQVSPSIDIDKLRESGDWQRVLNENLAGDMFVYASANNDFGDFEKIVQIVLNKGYTILKMDEML
jgi:hypothetical protein